MPKVDIPDKVMEQTAYLVCSMQITERNPDNLRVIADLLDFWTGHLPKPKEAPKGTPTKDDNKKEAK